MIEHTMLVSVEDAVSMSWKRTDGLAELCWGIIKDALFAIKADLIEAEGTLDELHKVSWARADKSHGAFCEAMKRKKGQDTNR